MFLVIVVVESSGVLVIVLVDESTLSSASSVVVVDVLSYYGALSFPIAPARRSALSLSLLHYDDGRRCSVEEPLAGSLMMNCRASFVVGGDR